MYGISYTRAPTRARRSIGGIPINPATDIDTYRGSLEQLFGVDRHECRR